MPRTTKRKDPVRDALLKFVDDIESTGGVRMRRRKATWLTPPKGGVVDLEIPHPVGDPSWTNLGYTYLEACKALGRKPMLKGKD